MSTQHPRQSDWDQGLDELSYQIVPPNVNLLHDEVERRARVRRRTRFGMGGAAMAMVIVAAISVSSRTPNISPVIVGDPSEPSTTTATDEDPQPSTTTATATATATDEDPEPSTTTATDEDPQPSTTTTTATATATDEDPQPSTTTTTDEDPELQIGRFEMTTSTRVIGLATTASGVYVTSDPVIGVHDWCSESTPIWRWLSSEDVNPHALLPGTVGRVHNIDDTTDAFLARCRDQSGKFAVHLVRDGRIDRTIDIPNELVSGLAGYSSELDGAIGFGRVLMDLETSELSLASEAFSFAIPGENEFRVASQPTEGQLGCEEDGRGHNVHVLDSSGSVVAELWTDNGPAFAIDAFTFAPDGFFVANRGVCGESRQTLYVGKISLDTGELEVLARLCDLPELDDNELSSYGFDVAVATTNEVFFWKAGLQQGISKATLNRDALPVLPGGDFNQENCTTISVTP